MSDSRIPHTVKGVRTVYSANSLTNTLHFAISQFVHNNVNTADVVIVRAVHAGGPGADSGYVDVQPLVRYRDAWNNTVETVTQFRLPYSRIQGGIAALVIDPVPGDIGLAVYTKADSSLVSPGQADTTQPGSFRTFSRSDGFYLGGFLNQAPEIWLELNQDKKAVLHAPEKVTIETKECVINASESTTVNTKSFTVNASHKAGIYAPNWDFGDLGGSSPATAHMRLNINQTGSHVSSGDQIAGGISQIRHTHKDVQPGSGHTGVPQ